MIPDARVDPSKTNTEKCRSRNPQASLDRITTLGCNSLEVQLLRQTGKLEFGFNMSRKLKKALPQHLWGMGKGPHTGLPTHLPIRIWQTCAYGGV
jgi:hypothetical protein